MLIQRKLLISFLGIVFIPLVFLGLLSLSGVEKIVKKNTVEKLQHINSSNALDISHLIRLRQEQAKLIAGTFLPRQLSSNGENSQKTIKKIQDHIDSIFEEIHLEPTSGYSEIDKKSFIDIIGVWDAKGMIVANTNRDLIGKSMPQKYLQEVKKHGTYFAGFEKDPLTGQNYLIILEIIRNWDDRKFSGTVALKVKANILSEILMNKLGLGKTGESYLINKDYFMITESRFKENAILNLKVDTEATQGCFSSSSSSSSSSSYQDYRGELVLGAHKYLSDQEWCLVTEIDEMELLVSVKSLKISFIGVGGIVFFIVLIISWIIAKSLSNPIVKLTDITKNIVNGDLLQEVNIQSKDEIGQLAISFNIMKNQLKESIERLEANVKDKTSELQKNVKEVEKNNLNLKRTKIVMTGMMKELESERLSLKESEGKVRSIVRTIADALIVINEKGIIDSINPGTEKIFGYTEDEVRGENVKVLMPNPYHSEHDGYLNSYVKTGEKKIIGHTSREVKGKCKNGKIIDIELSVDEMTTGIGTEKKRMFVGILRDITDRKKAERELVSQKSNLEKVNLELDSFVYTASHDLRAPLRGIASFANILQEDYSDVLDEDGLDYLTQINKGAKRLSDLIDDLLALSRISRVEAPYEEVDIKILVQEILERIEFDIKENHVQIVVQDTMPKMMCSQAKMGEVFLNLINNAIKFSSKNNKKHPQVEVGYELLEGYHQFYVKDNGIGIDPQFHEQTFGIFKRLNKEDEYEGTGVGLNIVKRIVEDHKGKVWIESKLGEGATFYFRISKNLKNKKKESSS